MFVKAMRKTLLNRVSSSLAPKWVKRTDLKTKTLTLAIVSIMKLSIKTLSLMTPKVDTLSITTIGMM